MCETAVSSENIRFQYIAGVFTSSCGRTLGSDDGDAGGPDWPTREAQIGDSGPSRTFVTGCCKEAPASPTCAWFGSSCPQTSVSLVIRIFSWKQGQKGSWSIYKYIYIKIFFVAIYIYKPTQLWGFLNNFFFNSCNFFKNSLIRTFFSEVSCIDALLRMKIIKM